MNADQYQQLAHRTEADQQVILDRLVKLGPQAMRLDNAARGLCGDAGEVSTAVQRYIEYGRELDVANLKEEVGDCLWRLSQVCMAAGFTMVEAMEANIRKLAARYPEKYTDHLANNRDLEAEKSAILAESRKRYEELNAKADAGFATWGSTLPEVEGKVLPTEWQVASANGERREFAKWEEKPCEVCCAPASVGVRDVSRDDSVDEMHWYCKEHNRTPRVLPNKVQA
jgi:NTP pyrophosphatase (non-canonical NTP hydrolase)